MPATHITAAEAEAVLKEQIAKGVVDQPIKASDVHGGKASVAWLHRVKAEAGALIHNTVTETYYIVKGAGTLVTGGSLGNPKPTDLSRVNAGMSQTGTRQGGESRCGRGGANAPRRSDNGPSVDHRSPFIATIGFSQPFDSRATCATKTTTPQNVDPRVVPLH